MVDGRCVPTPHRYLLSSDGTAGKTRIRIETLGTWRDDVTAEHGHRQQPSAVPRPSHSHMQVGSSKRVVSCCAGVDHIYRDIDRSILDQFSGIRWLKPRCQLACSSFNGVIAGDATAIKFLNRKVLVLVTGGRVVGSPFPIRVGVVGRVFEGCLIQPRGCVSVFAAQNQTTSLVGMESEKKE